MFIAFISILTFHLSALPLSQVNFLNNDRVGISIGTYSPPHIRHNEIFHQMLESQHVDYILALPNDVTPHKPFAIDVSIRLAMLEAAYRNHPRILYPDIPTQSQQLPFPLVKYVKKQLTQRHPNLKWIGILGLDSARNPWAKLGATIQVVDSWIIFTPNPNAKIPKNYGFRSVTPIYAPTARDIHSLEIRQAAQEQNLDSLREVLLEPVARLVLEHNLYRDGSPRARISDYIYNCWNLFQKYAH